MTTTMIPRPSKEAPLDELVELAQHYRRQNKTIGWTNGCFEILHAGHIDFLLKASRLADIFIVGVNSDASVAQVKGPGHRREKAWTIRPPILSTKSAVFRRKRESGPKMSYGLQIRKCS